MTSSPDGAESFKPLDPLTKIEKARDLFQLYFRPEGVDQYFNILLARDDIFQDWISKYIHIRFEKGATTLWAFNERLDIVKKCIGLAGKFYLDVYVKEA